MRELLTYDGFEPGRDFGEARLTLDEGLMRRWLKLFPDDAAGLPDLPEGFASVIVMRAYIELIGPRPPGNVHASQSFSLRQLPQPGQTVITRMTSAGREIRRERRWVTIASETRDEADNILFTGEMRLIWAA